MRQKNRAVQTRTRRSRARGRILTIRAAMQPGYLWSAICSGCPNWQISHATYREFHSKVRIHRIEHARKGQVTAV